MSEGVKSAWINGFCVIVGALIGIFSINIYPENDRSDYEDLKLKNIDLQRKLEDFSQKYEELLNENTNLNNTIFDLQAQIDTLIDNSSEYESLVEENAQLKYQISQLSLQLKFDEYKEKLLELQNNREEIGEQHSESKEDRTETYIQIINDTANFTGDMPSNKKYKVLNTLMGINGYDWYEIQIDGKKEYIRSDWATIVNDDLEDIE